MATGTTAAEAACRSRLIAVQSYAVFLDLTGGGDTARSRTEIRFSCREPGAVTFADLDAVAVHELVFNGAAMDPAVVVDGRVLLPDLAASNSLTIDATVAVTRSGSGLTRYTDPADGSQYVLANCYPTAAPRIFCCFDQPDLRAAVTLIVTQPAGWTCVANGEVLHHPADGGAGVWRFSTVAAMRPSEFTFCAGPYITVAHPDGASRTGAPAALPFAADADADVTGPLARGSRAATELTVRCRPTLAYSAGLARAAGIVGQALGYYEQLLGVPCPYGKLDIVFVPELLALAMQFPAVMYVSETLLQRAADPGDEQVGVVLAHEAAHLWFGCLVDGGWWDDLWLAEAMASYLSYGAATAVLDQPRAWAEFGMTGRSAAYEADSLPEVAAVSSPVNTAAQALTRPASITYSKGTAVIRQLAALIGDDAMRAGLREYLTRYAWSATSLPELIECWSQVSGRDLMPWADQWLRQPGVNVLRPEITVGPDGVITSFAVVQAPPSDREPLRTHQLTIGIYAPDGRHLACHRRISATVTGDWTHVPELTGSRMPAAIVVNDTDLTFATVRLDRASWRALVECAMDVADPLAESVCWNAAWQMVLAAEFDAAEFAAVVARRITTGRLPAGLAALLNRAVDGADRYAAPEQRAAARQQVAAAALATAERAHTADHEQRILARGYATSADSPAQLDLLRFWLEGRSLPAGLTPDLELLARALASLAARGRVTDQDLAAYAARDPVAGDTWLATIRARQPAGASKQAAWSAALAAGQPLRLALAHAQGIWVPGQEDLVVPFRERYFAEALPALRRLDARSAQRLARALYPATLADDSTMAATAAEIGRTQAGDPVRPVLVEQRAILGRVITARATYGAPAGGQLARS